MTARHETEATMSAVGIDLAGHDYKEIQDPNGDGVTRVWAKPGSMLASIMEKVVSESANKSADDKQMTEQIRREIVSGERPAEDEQFAACIEQGAYFDYDSLSGHGGLKQEESSEHDASYAKGWNTVASIVCHESSDFDADRFLAGAAEAIVEYRRMEADRTQTMRANQSDMQAIVDAVERLKAAGIKIVAGGGSVDFDNGNGIHRVNGPELLSDHIPF